MESPNLYPVKLYVYDLSKGLARRLSPIMLGEGAGRGREGRPEPGERVPGGPAEVGRPGRGARRRRGAQRWRKTQVKKGGGLWFGASNPNFPIFMSESREKGWKGITPSSRPSEPLYWGGGGSRRWIRAVPCLAWGPLYAPSSARCRGDEDACRVVPLVVKGTLQKRFSGGPRGAFPPCQKETLSAASGVGGKRDRNPAIAPR